MSDDDFARRLRADPENVARESLYEITVALRGNDCYSTPINTRQR